MKKLNFVGGEPFIVAKHLGDLVKYCKDDLSLESVSIVTNGSKVTSQWLDEYGKYVDIIAVSCDSFNEETNRKIGRGQGTPLNHVRRLSRMCNKHGIKFKINTVVNQHNFQEDMNEPIRAIAPSRWKVFQVLMIERKNRSDETLRDMRSFLISDAEFQAFCDAHSGNECFVPVSNDIMRSSYLLLDEYMRFLNKGVGEPTESILKVGVAAALKHVYWDTKSFMERGGYYY
ncbi:hypothetical protein MMC07_006020 [Pseudocyphellaria aurata]|nr:hypothetical protein [Pseudocyphellaria aurata]